MNARNARSHVARDGRSGSDRDGRSGFDHDGRSGFDHDGRSDFDHDGRSGFDRNGRSHVDRDARDRDAPAAARGRLALLLLAVPALGCAGTGQPEVSYEAHAEAIPPGEITAGAWTISLDEAAVAFGPLHLCAAASGSTTLCDVAIAEMTTITRVDLLDPAPQRLGEVRGFEGEIRSASFDYGIHWFLTESSPVRAPEAPGGHSARFRGRAARGAEVLEFEAEVDAIPLFQGHHAVPSLAVSARVTAEPVRLTVRFDVAAWISRVSFDALAAGGADGAAIGPGSREHNALALAMTAQRPPELVWSSSP